MADRTVLIDTGAFTALFDPDDQYHELSKKQFQLLPVGKAYTCWPVVTEAAYLIRQYPRQRNELLEGVATGEFPLLDLTAADIPGIRAILDAYRGHDIDLADAALVHLAAREDVRTIFTFDRRHFSFLRRPDQKPLQIVPEGP